MKVFIFPSSLPGAFLMPSCSLFLGSGFSPPSDFLVMVPFHFPFPSRSLAIQSCPSHSLILWLSLLLRTQLVFLRCCFGNTNLSGSLCSSMCIFAAFFQISDFLLVFCRFLSPSMHFPFPVYIESLARDLFLFHLSAAVCYSVLPSISRWWSYFTSSYDQLSSAYVKHVSTPSLVPPWQVLLHLLPFPLLSSGPLYNPFSTPSSCPLLYSFIGVLFQKTKL